MRPRIVIDTNVLIAALRSRRGASFLLLRSIGLGGFDFVVMVPLFLQYTDVVLRNVGEAGFVQEDADAVLRQMRDTGKLVEVYYLWRPILMDAKDDLVLEAAMNGGCSTIVTYNERDFVPAKSLGVSTLTPAAFLRSIGVLR